MEQLRIVRTRQDKVWNGSTWVFLGTYQVTPPLNDGPGGLGELVSAHPGSWWAIGNEPDRGPDPGHGWEGQDGIYPDLYAQAYHEVYQFIRERDPSARIGPGGLVEVTPGRLQYLDLLWQAYRGRYGVSMPADFWTFHVYVLPEVNRYGQGSAAGIALGTNPALAFRESNGDSRLCHDPNNKVYCYADHDDLVLFDQQVRRMRQWMKDHALQDRPLWLTEFGILWPFEDYDDPVNPTHCFLQDEFGNCFTPARVRQWLLDTFAYLESASDPALGDPGDRDRLVQRWAWYSLRVDPGVVGYVSNVVTGTAPYTLTLVGTAFQQDLLSHPAQANLLAYQALTAIADSGPAGIATATLWLRAVNNGDMVLTSTVTVTWYADAALSLPIASTPLTDQPGCGAGRWVTATAVVTWTGTHPYWVKVDAAGELPEFDETDNTAQGLVLIDPWRVYLPLVLGRGP